MGSLVARSMFIRSKQEKKIKMKNTRKRNIKKKRKEKNMKVEDTCVHVVVSLLRIQ